jgi:heme/copper-type cytochrome/quinol oxidase subunit 2
MLLIILMNVLALMATVALYVVAKAGIRHYMVLHQNESDVKKLNLITTLSVVIIFILMLLSCTLMITKVGYNTSNNNMEVEHGIRR